MCERKTEDPPQPDVAALIAIAREVTLAEVAALRARVDALQERLDRLAPPAPARSASERMAW